MSAPTDSVLKRHYEQMMSRGGGDSAPAASSPSPDGQSSGGFCAWLKKLFGG